MDDSTDLNIDNYTQDDLLALIGLMDKDNPDEDNQITYNDIVNATNNLINRFTSEDNYDLANFFQEVQSKLLEDIDYEENTEFNLLNKSNNQLGNLYQNQYPTQKNTNPSQYEKTTERKQQVNIFEQDGKFVMNKNQLGVSNTYQVPVAQGQLNPNLKNTTTRIINIDSNYRDNIIPYTADPDGPSSATNFTLDLSDPIFNTISLQLTSYTIPNTWYLIDSYNGTNCFFIDNSMVVISSGNYSVSELIDEINSKLATYNIDVSYNQNTGNTTFINNSLTNYTITFYDPTGQLLCNTTGLNKITSKFNNNLGWILGFRGNINIPNTNSLYGQLIYTLNSGASIISESIVDTFGSKYFLLVLDDFNQNHLNNGLIGITPTQKIAEIPSYWNADLACTITDSSFNIPTYTQNAPRRLTQAQLYTLNQTTLARSNTNKIFTTSPTTTDVLALIPLRKKGIAFGDLIVDDFNLDDAKRVYFGPIDLERMRIRLVDDKGYTVNLNGSNWSFTLTATSLYQY